jgi:hypothetical protein
MVAGPFCGELEQVRERRDGEPFCAIHASVGDVGQGALVLQVTPEARSHHPQMRQLS